MNQFRDLFMLLFIAFGLGLEFGHPENWTWVAAAGGGAVDALNFLCDFRPWSAIMMLAVALALFMTRLKY